MSDAFSSQDQTIQSVFNEMFTLLKNIYIITNRNPANGPVNDAIMNVNPTLMGWIYGSTSADDFLNALRDANSKIGS